MYRIKDPRKSLPFYTEVLGMTMLFKSDFPDAKFSMYILGYQSTHDMPEEEDARRVWAYSGTGNVELVHNWGTESDPDLKHHNGNEAPRGFGHISLLVPDLDQACERFEEMGVEFIKKPNGGRMKGLAHIKDPDGYWIEVFNNDHMDK